MNVAVVANMKMSSVMANIEIGFNSNTIDIFTNFQ